jgi:AAHS family benzoate transporter-like MFS transporter
MTLNFVAFAIPGLVSVLATLVFMLSRRQQVARENYALAV